MKGMDKVKKERLNYCKYDNKEGKVEEEKDIVKIEQVIRPDNYVTAYVAPVRTNRSPKRFFRPASSPRKPANTSFSSASSPRKKNLALLKP